VLHQGLSIKKFLDNEYVGLHYNLGLAHEQMGDLAKALGEYEQVYILDITYKDVAARLRRIEAQLKVQAQPAAEAKPASTAPSETEPRPEPDTTPVAVIEAAPEAPLQVEPAPSAADMPPETDLPPQPAEAAEVLEPAPVMMPEAPAPAVEFPGGQPSPNEEAREEIYLKDQGLSFL
jgi:tetratricopeptide (TPR) repeat protein